MSIQTTPRPTNGHACDFEDANDATIRNLLDIQKSVQKAADEQLKSLHSRVFRTYDELKVMIWVAFILGCLLLMTAAALPLMGTVAGSELPLGLGALGLVDLLALFFYKPMERMQKASADISQQIVLLRSWGIAINLEMLAMSVKDPESVLTAARNIRSTSEATSKSINEFVEP